MYTKKDVYAYGYIAGLIESATRRAKKRNFIKPSLLQEACSNPHIGFIKIYNLAMKNNIIDEKTDIEIGKVMDYINAPDDDYDPNYRLPLSLQGTWRIAYYHALNGKSATVFLEQDENGILAMRKAAGFSQKKLADALGCGQGHISRWEAGIVTPSVENLKKMAEVLGCSIDQLTSK